MMEDSNSDNAKLKEEIEAELDKISISSLEKDDMDSDSKSETQSDDGDTDLDELPESVLHCINIIKNKSKTAEELILQELEDTDVLSCGYGAVSNNHVHLRIELSTEYKENQDQLMKMLSEIEKKEFLRSKTRCSSPDSVPEPSPHDLPMDDHDFPDDGEITFGYCEVEERCRQSFEAWQDKQKELEDQEKEALKAQKDGEEKQFQEEEEKRHCWMKQFEIEKKKLEDIQKQAQDKMNDELRKEEKMWQEKFKQHEEFIRNLQLQMEEERTRFKDRQEKEKMHLLKLRHNAAVKIQANYRAFMAYQKYGPIIKEQVEAKKRQAQKWKEKEAKLQQMEEEQRKKRLEEEQRLKEEIKRQNQEKMKRRKEKYEEKKNILRQEKEQLLNKEESIFKEERQQLVINKALKNGGYSVKHLTVEDTSKNQDDIVKKLGYVKSKKGEEVPPWLAKESNNVDRQLVVKESVQVLLKESTSNQANLAEFKVKEKNEKLTKQQCSEKLVKQERKYENIDKKTELGHPDRKANTKEQFQLQELKSPTQMEENLKPAISDNMIQETQMIILGHNQEINELENNEAHKIIKDNQQNMIQKIEKEEILEQDGTNEENKSSVISVKQKLLPLILRNSENVGGNVIPQEKDTDLKSNETENSKSNSLNSDVIFNAGDAMINVECKIKKNSFVLGGHTPCEESSGCNTKNPMIFKEENLLMSQIKKVPEECHENRAECESIMTCSVPEPTLLSCIEEKRLAWIKSLKPWLEIFKENQQKKIVKRKRLVKCPADIMPPLNAQEILRCGPWNTLQQHLIHSTEMKTICGCEIKGCGNIKYYHAAALADDLLCLPSPLLQVTKIAFQDLPGCSISTLAECTNLQCLSLQRCGLTSLHSLNNCKKLKYVDVQDNNIETISCENLENLCVVLLNKNKLTSFHGFDDCTNIQNLELSHNKITRIGGLESLKSLQKLVVDHNQLISTKGLHDTPTIIYLDCSHNHLTEVEGIENCGLLQILKLQGNYLSELPCLENHVLLRELYLDDNSISTVEALSSFWLPLLQNLSLSQNSLTKIIPLFHFISLEKLDVSNNCLSDLKSAINGFTGCHSLCELTLTGNPLLQEINWRHSLLKMLPALRILNGEMLNCYTKSHTEEYYKPELGHFQILCQSQNREFNLLTENYVTENGNVFSLDAAENLCHYFKKLIILSNEYRCAHEHSDISFTKTDESEVQRNHLAPTDSHNLLQSRALHSCTNEHKQDSPGIPEKWMNSVSSLSPLTNSSLCEDVEERNQEKIVGKKREDSKASSIPTKRTPLKETVMTSSLLRNHANIEHCEKIIAATIIQAYWRGSIVRRQTTFSTERHTTATGLVIAWPNSCIQKQTILKNGKRENTVDIQKQREKAAVLIQAIWKGFLLRKKLTAALEAIKNEESEEEYEEIDLEDFTFDEAALEKEWPALDSTRFPSQTQLLPNQLHWPKFSGTLNYDDTSFNLPSHPVQAWLCNEKENVFSSEHTQFNGRSENRSVSQTLESKTSRKSLLKSEKEEKISEEWGFKDISTAQQMLKRAQKMKSKKLKKKLDPIVRLALFRNNESKISVTKSLKNTQPGRDGYFEGKEEFIHKDTTSHEKLERGKEYTYQWLHTQVAIPETSTSRNTECNHFLPELHPDVLNGGRVQLVARLVSREDTDLDLFSMTSGSALSVKRNKKNKAHIYSAGSSRMFAPMVTNTGPSKKERMSFRDNPVQLSGGWGSGKKKVKPSR